MTKEQTIKEKFQIASIVAKIRNLALTFMALLCMCGAVSAQTKEEKDDENGKKRETKVGFNNISALEIQKDKTVFYNDLMPTFSTDIHQGNFYGNFTAAELLIMKNGDFSTINNKCLFEIGRYFGPDFKFFIKAGRDVTELSTIFLNGVENLKYNTEQTLALFGNLSERVVLGIQKDGTMIELGVIGKYGDGIFIIPNPQQADFWAKISQSFQQADWRFVLTATADLGNTNKLSGAVTATNGHIGITSGGNYSFDTDAFNAYIRGAYNSINTGITYIMQAMKKGETYSIQIGASKKGLQGFMEIDNLTPTQRDTPQFTSTPTVNMGISYSFGGNKKL